MEEKKVEKKLFAGVTDPKENYTYYWERVLLWKLRQKC